MDTHEKSEESEYHDRVAVIALLGCSRKAKEQESGGEKSKHIHRIYFL
jgi:hypothetical protein